MPKVPDNSPPMAPAMPDVKPEYLMMAAAVMHEQGRLFEPRPEPKKESSNG